MARCASGYMLENPVVSRTTRVVRSDIYSDKVTGAENQQERLIEFRGWVIGFVDGEGCFSIGFVRPPDRPGRAGYRTGFEEVQTRPDQNPQRPYARHPGHWMMRWSRLHGDMQGLQSKEVGIRPVKIMSG
jgi:hypothetical protein